MAAASVGKQDGHLWAQRGCCFRLGSLSGGWLFGLPGGGLEGVVLGGRWAVILKSHGFDLLQQKESKGTPVRGDTWDISPWGLVCAASLYLSLQESLMDMLVLGSCPVRRCNSKSE